MGNSGSGIYFEQTEDIVITGVYRPIGYYTSDSDCEEFAGNYDGNSKTISGTISNDSDSYVAVFGYTKGATITNLATDIAVTGNMQVGGIVGYAHSTTITNCDNTGNIIGNTYVGGIAGSLIASTITNCYNTGNITATGGMVAGITARASYDTKIENCYNAGTITNSASYYSIGGIVSYVSNSITIVNCYNIGNIIMENPGSDTIIGGVLGILYSGTATITNCYYNSDNITGSTLNSTNDGTGLTTAQMTGLTNDSDYAMTGITTVTWTFTADQTAATSSVLTTTYTYPVLTSNAQDPAPTQSVNLEFENAFAGGDGTEEYPYEISSLEELNNLAAFVNAGKDTSGLYFIQTADIEITGDYAPIGYYTGSDDYEEFSGNYDGNSKTISGTIDNSGDINVGVFGYTKGATITDLTTDITVKGNANVGGVVGYAVSTEITNCHNTGAISATNSYAGGVVGYVTVSTIDATIQNCSNTGAISGSSYVGGIAGRVYTAYGSKAITIEQCYNAGDLTGTNSSDSYIGGIAGEATINVNYETNVFITQCYNTANLTASNSTSKWTSLGGIVGYVGVNYSSNTLTISECYSIGDMVATGTEYIGGTIGRFTNNGTLTAESCYYNSDICTVTSTAYGTALTTTQIAGISNSLAGFDSDSWTFGYEINEDGDKVTYYYPVLVSNTQDPAVEAYTDDYTDIYGLYFDGSGTKEDPYEISSLTDLNNLAYLVNNGNSGADIYFEQTEDIEITGDYAPIGYYTSSNDCEEFAGNYDGNSKTISGTISNGSDSYVAVFGYTIGATITNLATNIAVTGNMQVGGIVGYANGTTITNCYNTGNIIGKMYVGGIAGSLIASTITNCYNTGNITATGGMVAGITAGATYNTKIENCYNAGTITNSASYYSIGGIVSYVSNSITIVNCYNIGNIIMENQGSDTIIGGVLGILYSGTATITNCYYNSDNITGSTLNSTNDGTALTTAQMTGLTTDDDYAMNGITTTDWAFTADKDVVDGDTTTTTYTYPVLISNEQDPAPSVDVNTYYYTVTITLGDGMTSTSTTTQRVEVGTAITDIVITADSGYGFITDYLGESATFMNGEYSVTINGITITRNSSSQITISGTPTKAVSLTLADILEQVNAVTPTITTALVGTTYTYDADVTTLDGTATTTDSGTISYQWYSSSDGSNWSEIDGATSATYTPSSTTVGTTYYKVIATNTITDNGDGGTKTATTSSTATIKVNADVPVFGTDLDTDTVEYTYSGTATALTVSTNVKDGGTITYQWYSSSDNSNWSEISGATSTSYTPSTSTVGTTYYKCVATNTQSGETSTADSKTATITVNQATPTVTISASKDSTNIIVMAVSTILGTYEDTYTITAEVTGVNSEDPTGTVTIMNGTETIASNLTVTDGVATYAWTEVTVADYTLTAEFTATADTNYTNATSSSAYYTIEKADQTISIADVGTVTYGDDDFTLSVSRVKESATLSYEVTSGTAVSVDSDGKVKILSAGEVTIKVTAAETTNYNSDSEIVTFTVAQKELDNDDVDITGVEESYIFTNSAITPTPVVTYETIDLVAGTDYEVSYSNNTAISTDETNATVTITFQGNYTGTATATFDVVYGTATSEMISYASVNDNGWYTDDITISAAANYDISTLPTSDFGSSITISTEGEVADQTYYMKGNDGKIYVGTFTYSLDKTAPTVEIEIETSLIKKVINTITFGMFFKETVTVTITGSDNLIDDLTIEYQKVTSGSSYDARNNWTEGNSFSVDPNETFTVYARVTDEAGNMTTVNSTSITAYTDSTPETTSFEFVKSGEDTSKSVEVELNGNTIQSITIGENTVDTDNYTVSEEVDDITTITFLDTYLDDFDGGTYTFTINYNPLGETYEDGEGNEAPTSTTVTANIYEVITDMTETSDISVYTGKAQSSTIASGDAGVERVTVKYSDDEGVTYTLDTRPSFTDAGTYTIYYELSADNHKTVYGEIEFTIAQATPTVTVEATKDSTNIIAMAIGTILGTYEDSYTITATVIGTANGDAPTGTVTIMNGETVIASNLTVTDGVATYAWTSVTADNYTLTAEFTATADTNYKDATSSEVGYTIEKADQDISIADVGTITYGDEAFTLSVSGTKESASLSYEVTSGTAVEVGETTGIVTIKSAGEVTITVTAAATTNYNSDSETITFKVEQKDITWDDFTYDFDNLVYIGEAITPVSSDLVADTDYTIVYTDNIDAGTATVTITGINNYDSEIEKTFTISAKQLTVSGTTVADKIYDGTTDVATADITIGTVTGVVGDESTGLTATATFDDANVNTGIVVEVVYSVTNTNYIAPVTETVTADIKAKQLTISGTSVDSKTYDGDTTAIVTAGTLADYVDGETVEVKAEATFSDENVGTDKTVTVVYNTTDINYIAPITETTTASITAKEITVTIDSDQGKYYGETDGTLTYNYTDAASGEKVAFTGILSRQTGESIGSYAISENDLALADNGAFQASNYSLIFGSKETVYYTISQKDITATATNPSDWLSVGTVTITAPDGYTISLSNGTTDTFTSFVTVDTTQAEDVEVTYYLRDSDGAISEANTFTYSNDQTAPTGEITIKSNSFKEFINTISFNMFFKNTVDVAITGSDELSGVARVEYQKVVIDETYSADGTWTEDDGFSVVANEQFVVYARITDNAGNVTIINSDGVTVYTDSEQDTASISFTKLSTTDVTADVTTNGNTILAITNDGYTLTSSDYTVSSEVDNTTTITFKASYLDTLSSGDYTFTISYNPLGETYVGIADNEAPTDTEIALTVSPKSVTDLEVKLSSYTKVYDGTVLEPTVTVYDGETEVSNDYYTVTYSEEVTVGTKVVSIEFSEPYTGTLTENVTITEADTSIVVTEIDNASYENDITLTATVTGVNGEIPTGTVTFYNDEIEVATVDVASDGTATYTMTSPTANTYSITAKFTSSDDNYSDSTTTAATEFDITKINQEIEITEVTAKTYGDDIFTLAITGQNDTGTVTYSVADDNGVVTITDNTVTIIGAGTVTITATVDGDNNYNGDSVTYDLTVAQKALSVEIDDQEIVRGMNIPTFTSTVSGNVNGDVITVAYTTITDNMTAGDYTITMMNASDYPNYDIAVASGTLTITDGYTVSFDDTEVTDIAYGATVSQPTDPTKDGYVFMGWYLGDSEFDFTTAITGDLELTSVWEAEVEKEIEVAGDAEVTIDAEVEQQLLDELFTEEEIALNVEMKVAVQVDIVEVTDMDESAQEEFDSYLEEYQADLDEDEVVVQAIVFDISVIKSLAGVEENITVLETPIRITIEIPEEYQADGREFFILRNHDGEITILEDLDDDPTTITIETDRFSNYTLNYVETVEVDTDDTDAGEDDTDIDDDTATTVPDTGDHSSPQMLMIVMFASLLGILVVRKKKLVK